MKKKLALILVLVLALTACGAKEADDAKITIGISPGPQEAITEIVKAQLKEQKIDLEVKVFNDYVQPNVALDDGSIDANFFQHKPYMDLFVEEKGAKLMSLGGVHIEPIAFYSDKVTSLDDLKEGDEILIPNDLSNGARALLLLDKNGLIKMDESKGLNITEKDIVENPKNIKITPVDASLLTRTYTDVAGAVINSNFAINAGLNPLKDGVVIEDEDSIYANIIAIREEDKDLDKMKILIEAYQSEEVKDFIISEYDGSIIPAFK